MFNACLRPIALYFLVMLPVVVLKFIEDKICVVSYSSINVELQCLQFIILSLAFFECGHNYCCFKANEICCYRCKLAQDYQFTNHN